MAGERSYLWYSTDRIFNDYDQSIDALLSSYKWDTTSNNVLTYGFIASQIEVSYSMLFGSEISEKFADDPDRVSAANRAIQNFDDVIAVDFVFQSTGATLRFGYSETINGASGYGYYPFTNEQAGDTIYNGIYMDELDPGDFGYFVILHELGHAMGLRHGHEDTGPGAMLQQHDSNEYSVMTYNSFVGQNQSPAFNTNETGHNPQTLMMYDIAALQRMYGANFNTHDTDTVYSVNPATGAFFIDGVGQGDTAANIILRTVWDGGGTDTYDFSNVTLDVTLSLQPGEFVDLSTGSNHQRARLNDGWDVSGSWVGPSAFVYATGHIYNALLYNDDPRSLIENATTGDGDDAVTGNVAANRLDTGLGSDLAEGLSGADTIIGGGGCDTLKGGNGTDVLLGGAQQDHIWGNKGSDTIKGGNGLDRMWGGNGADEMRGQKGNDRMWGGAGHDTLIGGHGNDKLIGCSGNDKLTGGAGADDFIFAGLERQGHDTVTDFDTQLDRLSFSGLIDSSSMSVTLGDSGQIVAYRGGTVLLTDVFDYSLDDVVFI